MSILSAIPGLSQVEKGADKVVTHTVGSMLDVLPKVAFIGAMCFMWAIYGAYYANQVVLIWNGTVGIFYYRIFTYTQALHIYSFLSFFIVLRIIAWLFLTTNNDYKNL